MGFVLAAENTWQLGSLPSSEGEAVVKIKAKALNNIRDHLYLVLESFLFLFFFLGPHPWHMEVPRLGVLSKLWLPASVTATATQDLSCICDLHHCSQQHQILNPLSKARDRTRIFMDTGWVHYCWAPTRTPGKCLFISTRCLLRSEFT